MELIKNFFNNQWVINIGTGLIVYIVTTAVSRIILNKATNREKQKQIENANNEVIRILKPYVVEKNVLNENIIMCIIKSVARKYNVHFKEIFNVIEICEELTREILENSYLDNEKKIEYISHLDDIMEENKSKVELKENLNVFLKKAYQTIEHKNKLYNILSLYMSFIVMFISIFVTIFSKSEYNKIFSISEPVLISMLIIITEISMLLSLLYIKKKNYKKELENNYDIREKSKYFKNIKVNKENIKQTF